MRVLDCWGFQHAAFQVSSALPHLCIGTHRIHTYKFRSTDLPFRIARTVLLVVTSSSFGRLLELVMRERQWHPPAAVIGLFSEAECSRPAKLDTWHWDHRWDRAQGMLMHYRLFPIGGVICLMLRGGSSHLQGNLVGAAWLGAIWQTPFKTGFWHVIIRKILSSAFRQRKENFLLKETKKTVELLQD